MDLKKYLDSIPSGQYMDPMLVKVIVLATHFGNVVHVCLTDHCWCLGLQFNTAHEL